LTALRLDRRAAARHSGLAALLLLAFAVTAAAQTTVSMSGSLGSNKALLMIDGSPRTVAVGSTVQGVRLVSVDGNEAVVEVGGKRATLRLGASQVNLGGKGDGGGGGGSRIVLSASGGGHFMAAGSINGKATRFMVDTGASLVSIGQDEAERLGLKYRDGQVGRVSTANGDVPAYRVTLHSLRIGDVQVYEVQALVMPAPMPYILLGNSFLTRFQMKRENDTLTLDRRY
jgi:aspartyl protease family protein